MTDTSPTDLLLKLMLLERLMKQGQRRKVKTPAINAIKIKSTEALRAALNADPTLVNQITDGYGTPILYTIRKGWYEGAQVLLRDYHANPNLTPDDQYTPLFYAAATDNASMMSLLLEYGANFESLEGDANVNIVEHICRVMATLGKRSNESTNVESLKFTLRYIAQRPALHYMLWRQNMASSGRTTLHYALQAPNALVLYILLEYMSAISLDRLATFINAVDTDGDTALHLAAKADDTGCIDILRHYGASTTIRNGEQKTPVECAKMSLVKKALIKRYVQ
uniref:Ankyrin repeat protein n=1 Tax=Clandestinovirus TaxID=2831644 RepID=A0A8F8PR51_9VIRU|nr:ankyrin repeat protein [Clandestinovirus]